MEPFIGQIQAFGFSFAPKDWAHCNGQTINISENQTLYSLLGTTFGGNGRTTFNLPDLRGRSIVHPGTGPGLTRILYGQMGGSEAITLNNNYLPTHSHTLAAATVTVQTVDNTNDSAETDNGANALGTAGTMPSIYRETPSGTDHLGGVSLTGQTDNTGASRALPIRNPFCGIYISISLLGIYPTRS